MKTMVKAILCNLLFFAVCYTGSAQSDSGKKKSKTDPEQQITVNTDKTVKKSKSKVSKYSFLNNGNYVMLADGKVYRKVNGKIHVVTSSEQLQSYLKITPEGALINKKGVETKLVSGEIVNENGDVVKADANWLLSEKINIAKSEFKTIQDKNRELEDMLVLMNERIRLMEEKANMEAEKINLLRSATLCVMRMTRDEKIDMNGRLQLVDDRIQVVNTKLNGLNDKMAKNSIYE